MTVSEEFWRNYATKLSEIDERAATLMRAYIDRYGVEDTEALVNYAYRLVQRYGAASTELACEMYETLAEYSSFAIPAAVPAEVANYNEVAKVVQGARKQSLTGDAIPGAVSRLVKQAGADTMLQNAARDGAEWAWVPMGDTCAFCITLASNGWQRASRRVREGLHAQHIHANCDCTFAIRFHSTDEIEGYDPDRYLEMYYGAEGDTPHERINSMRREFYARNKKVLGSRNPAAEEYLGDLLDTYKSATMSAGEESLLQLSSHNMFNSSSTIYERAKHVPPIHGYDDVFIHADAIGVQIEDAYGNQINLPGEEFVDILKMMKFDNDRIRLCACNAGALDDGIASYVARELDMPVMAPTTDVWIPSPDANGVSEMRVYANAGNDKPNYDVPGYWRVFYPDGRIEEVK